MSAACVEATAELLNFDPKVKAMLFKMISAKLCSTVHGQVGRVAELRFVFTKRGVSEGASRSCNICPVLSGFSVETAVPAV